MEKDHLRIVDLALPNGPAQKQVVVSPPDHGYKKRTGNILGSKLQQNSQHTKRSKNRSSNQNQANQRRGEGEEEEGGEVAHSNGSGQHSLWNRQAITTKNLLIANSTKQNSAFS